MFKANSLHHFNPSSPLYMPLLPTNKNPFTIVRDQENNLLRKYELPLSDYFKDSHLIDWRKRIHHPIPRITQITQYSDSQQKPFVSVLCEHISLSFIELRPLKLQEIIYCLSQMLLGYQEIHARLGFVAIENKLIGLNQKGQILLWVSDNLLAQTTEYPRLTYEKQIVSKIVALLESKTSDPTQLFFTELKLLEPKFKTLLDFIMAFKNKHKLKIIPKILVQNPKFPTEKMMISNTFSNNSDKQLHPPSNHSQNGGFSMKTSSQMGTTQFQNPFLGTTVKPPSNQSSVIRNPNHTRNRTSIIMQQNVSNTPVNSSIINSIQEKSAPKINFSYSQKRQQISTPKGSQILREYTSDKHIPVLAKIHSETNPIKEFTLEDKKSAVSKDVQGKRVRNNSNKQIFRVYNASYTPGNRNLSLQTQQDLKRSKSSYISSQQSSYISKQRQFGDFCQNKASMTTNHRSAVTQSFQSLGKSSNDDEYYNRRNDMFTSNHSNRTTYSIIRSSFVENQQGKNAVSFVIGNSSQQRHLYFPLNHHPFLNTTSHLQIQTNERRKDMYTFGGLMTPLLDQTHDLKQSTTIPEHPSPQQKVITQTEILPRPSLANQLNTKSIDELYNNLYFNSEKKSLIMDECQYNIKLSPVKEEVHSHANESFTIELSEIKNHEPLSHAKKPPSDRSYKNFFTPKIQQMNTFDYNDWRGIKGLLNESNVYELKESIHCGPDIRSPMNNVKLELLDKFGREIGQSILPSTPSGGHVSRAHSVYTITDEHSMEY